MILVSIDGIVVIAGDLFEKEDDLKDEKIWIDAGVKIHFFYSGCFFR